MDELRQIVENNFSIDSQKRGIFGHSMGGHGALTLALRHPDVFQSISAFAPICAPTQCPWGKKAFSGYLGEDTALWEQHDASRLIQKNPFRTRILIDQGTEDEFLAEQLHPEVFRKACESVSQPLELRMQEGYDHSYYFISTFIEDHLEHHARELG